MKDKKKTEKNVFPNEVTIRKTENVDSPAHYSYGVDNVYEVINVCEAWGLDTDAYLFNVVKYVARSGKKDPSKEIEDLKKAMYYLKRKINNMENK